MKFSFALTGISLYFSCVSCYYFATDYEDMLQQLYAGSVPAIRIDSLTHMDSSYRLIDTRTEREYECSHIQQAEYWGYEEFDLNAFTDQIKKSEKIVLYCSVGYRSERIAERLKNAGYQEVYNLYGGIFQWVNDGLPVVNSKNEPTDSIHAYNRRWGRWINKGIKVYE